jgi:hypothetical protein
MFDTLEELYPAFGLRDIIVLADTSFDVIILVKFV